MSTKTFVKKLTCLLGAIIICGLIVVPNASAIAFNLSPMFQNITLTPGENYVGNFQLTNNYGSAESFDYVLSVEPFTVDENNDITLTVNGDYNQIVDWISLENTEGSVAPNETVEVRFNINVPANAAAGGQYASILVRSKEADTQDEGVQIKEVYQSAHLIYADVAGETIRRGDINEIYVPSFLTSGNISGMAKIKNLGNVHSRATATLQVFPLFSKEEVFTNEENPDTVFIMPDSTRAKVVAWEETPSVGIFHVIFKASFEGVESKVDKYVIVCPLWLLFLIVLAIFLIIFRILSAKKKN